MDTNNNLLGFLVTGSLIAVIGLFFLWEEWKKMDKTHHRIVTCPQAVVSFSYTTSNPIKWHYASNHMNWAAGKIQDILEANPNADLKAFEKELNITFTNIQLNPNFNIEQPRTTDRRPGFLGSDNQ